MASLNALENTHNFINANCDAEGRVGFLPDLRVCPIIALVRAINDRVESGVYLPACKNI